MAFHRKKFKCPWCERMVTHTEELRGGKYDCVRVVCFREHVVAPRSAEWCEGSGKRVDCIPKASGKVIREQS